MNLPKNLFCRGNLMVLSLMVLGVLSNFSAQSQVNDSNIYKQIRFFKLNQANDLFTVWNQSDKYYTDCFDMEFAHPIFDNKVSDAVLIGFNTPYKDYSLSFNQDMYTPENTDKITVDSTDRPYAGQLYFTYAKYSNQFWRARKLVARAFIGIQGPWAFAKESQNGVHGMIDNKEVMGWDNQLSNGIILDYQVQYLQLIQALSSPITELHYFGTARLGTLNSSAEIGFRFKFGHYTDSYMNFYGIANTRFQHHFTATDVAKMSNSRRKMIPKRIREKSLKEQAEYLSEKLNRKFQFYFFLEGTGEYILRDGSVEGSLIQFSPNQYEYNYSDYKHFKAGGRYGFVLQYSHFYLEFARYASTDNYQENGFFGYGRIILAWVF